MFEKLKLPPYAGTHESMRTDGKHGLACNACEYPVDDHDEYCSKCGARLAETRFYYGLNRKVNKKPKGPTLTDVLKKI